MRFLFARGIRSSGIEIPASITAVEFYKKFGYDYKNGVRELDGEGHIRLEKFKEVTSMCEALKELWAEDIEKSRNDGICRAIKSCRALGGTKEQVQTVLADNYDITEEQAQEYIELYW